MGKTLKKANFWIFSLLIVFCALFLAKLNVYAMDIKVEEVKIFDKSDTITVSDPSITDNKIASDITFNKVDDFVVFDLVLKNNDSKSYTIKSMKDNVQNEYVTVSYDVDGKDSDIELGAGKTVTMRIKLTYKKELINVESMNFDDVSVTVDMEKEDGTTSELIINPSTGDNIISYVVILGVSIIAIVLIVLGKKIGKVKVGYLLLVAPLLYLPYITLANELFELNFKFSKITVIGEMEEYTITINNEGTVTEIIKKYNDSMDFLPEGEKPGYTLVGWVDENNNPIESGSVITGETSLTAVYELDTYKIKYNLNGGELVDTNPTSYTINDEFTLINPTKEGYTFSGWKEGENTPVINLKINKGTTGDKTYTAVFTPIPYTINLNLAGGTLENAPYSYTIEDEIVLGAPTKNGYSFAGWQEGDNTPVKNLKISKGTVGDKTYTAVYSIITYSISYQLNDGTIEGTNPTTYTVEDEITLINPTKAGYTFSGWTDSENVVSQNVTIAKGTTGNKTYTAGFTANTNTPYTVYYKALDIHGENYEIVLTDNLTGTTDTKVTPEIKQFPGLIPPTSEEELIIAGDGSGELTYYYGREKRQLTIQNQGSVISEFTTGEYYYDTPITLKAKKKPAYLFNGWSNGEQDQTITFNLTEDTTISPTYLEQKSTIVISVTDELDEAFYKTVSISYTLSNITEAEVINQYSTDGKVTWKEYDGPFLVRDNITVDARTVIVNENNYEIGSKYSNIINIVTKTTVIDTGANINAKMISLAGGVNNIIVIRNATIQKYNAVKDSLTNDNIVSIEGSETPTYMWFDNGTIFYFAETNRVKLGADSSGMFKNLTSLTTLSVEILDTTQVTNMDEMFYGDESLEEIYGGDKFITTQVTSSVDMFKGDIELMGGAGTEYSEEHIDKEYARIDTPSTPGYFSE